MTLPLSLRDIISKIFSDEHMKKCGMSFLQAQRDTALEYANYLSEKNNNKTAIQAGTGTGKSIAYIVTAIVHRALSSEKNPILIVTYTKSLRSQLINSDIEKAKNIVEKYQPLWVSDLNYIQYESLSAFADPDIAEKNENEYPEWHKFVSEGYKNFKDNNGEPPRISDFLVESSNVPEEPYLVEHSGNTDLVKKIKSLYKNMDGANIVVMTHAMFISEAIFPRNSNKVLSKFNIIIDEGENILRVYNNFGSIKLNLTSLSKKLKGDDKKSVQSIFSTAQEEKKDENLIYEYETRHYYIKTLSDIKASLDDDSESCRIKDKISQIEIYDSKNSFFKDIKGLIFTIKKINTDFYLVIEAAKENCFFLRKWLKESNHYEHILFTSATLETCNDVDDQEFSEFLNYLDILSETNTSKITSNTHGKVNKYCFYDGDVEYDYNNSTNFIKHLANSIEQIDKFEIEPILVLFPSSKEKNEVYDELNSELKEKIHVQEVAQLLNQKVIKEKKILFAHCYAGANITNDDGSSYFKTVAFSRIPFGAVSSESKQMNRNNLLFKKRKEEGYTKIIQGIGRGLRKSSDNVTVYFLDTRINSDSLTEELRGLPDHLKNAEKTVFQ